MLVVTAERLKYSGHPSVLTKMCPPPPESRGHGCTFVFFCGKDNRILRQMQKESVKNQGSA